jgi:hypothetical protein
MKGEPGMDLLKVLGLGAEVQEGRECAERFCLGGGKMWERVMEEMSKPLNVRHGNVSILVTMPIASILLMLCVKRFATFYTKVQNINMIIQISPSNFYKPKKVITNFTNFYKPKKSNILFLFVSFL